MTSQSAEPSQISATGTKELTSDQVQPTTFETSITGDDAPSAGNRRLYRRYPTAIPAELEAGGKRWSCAITDMSLGGVGVEPAIDCDVGADCRLYCEDFYFDDGMLGLVANINNTATHIAFKLDQDMEAALTMFLVMSPATR